MIKQSNQPLVLSEKQLPLEIATAYRQASQRLLLLDYDGTLVDFASAPGKARPNAHVIELIALLSADSRNRVAIISGRDRQTLDNWFGHLPVGLSAEHGAFSKEEVGWQTVFKSSSQWKETIKPVLSSSVSSLPGSKIEEKETAIVFHYRFSPNLKAAQAEAELLAQNLLPVLDSLSLEIRRDEREMVVEVKQAGANKGSVVREWLNRGKYDFILCAGDSTSDEAMFKVLPAGAISIKVGPDETEAKYRVKGPNELIEFLSNLAKAD